jgi:hypothetical protein
MKVKITKSYLLIIGLVLSIIISCKKKEGAQPDNFTTSPTVDVNESETIHTDTTYEYEYCKGESGNYEYNYDVSGTDDNGDEISGNVSTNGKYGSGTITNSNGEEIEVETVWIGKGVLKATDDDGNEYEMEVD